MKFLLIYYNIKKTESSPKSFEKQINDNTVNKRGEGVFPTGKLLRSITAGIIRLLSKVLNTLLSIFNISEHI